MPLVGVTDQRPEAYLPRIGTLHKGGPKPDGGIGPDLDHFRFSSTIHGAEAAFAEYYGDHPTSVSVIMPFGTPEQCFETGREAKTPAGKLLHICDGKTMSRWWDAESHTYRTDPVPCAGKCKQFGRLDFFVPELIGRGYAGIVSLYTSSWNDIRSFWSTLCTIYARSGSLTGQQFILRRVKRKVHYNDKGTDRSVSKWLVVLQPAGDWVVGQIATAGQEVMDEGASEGAEESYEEEAEPVEETAPTTQPAEQGEPEKNGKLTRPAKPEELRDALEAARAYYAGPGKNKAKPASRENLIAVFDIIGSAAIPQVLADRHPDAEWDVVQWLTGVDSVGDLDDAAVSGLFRWLLDGQGQRHNAVAAEIESILYRIDFETEDQEMASESVANGEGQLPW